MSDALAIDPRVSLALFAGLAIFVALAALGVSGLLRARGQGNAFGIYESGAPVGEAMRAPVPVAYFQIAAFFVIFDFEAAVLFTWAVSAPDAGWPGLVSAAIFIFVLLAALVYLWADGALDTGARSKHDAEDGA